jgi:hypothetical protein
MKNKQISACIFPETVPGDEILFPLVQIFSRLVYCRAVEEDEIPEELQSPFSRQLEDAGLGRTFVPAPLGDKQRQRFLALIKDLRTRGDDYAAQLKNLSLSGIGKARASGRETKSSIIENLLKMQGVTSKKQEERDMLLWQARLLLKLGEIFDGDQMVLHREMKQLQEREQGIFSELRKDPEGPFSLTRSIDFAEKRSDGLPRLRLKAWTRLFCLSSQAPEDFDCFVTTNQDAVDLLAEEYERLSHNSGQSFANILLPAHFEEEFSPDKLQELQEQGKDFFSGLTKIMNDPDGLSEDQPADFADDNGEWAQLLETIYPKSGYGRCCLHLYFFPSISGCELFMETFGRDEHYVQQLQQGEEGRGCTVGWLELPPR